MNRRGRLWRAADFGRVDIDGRQVLAGRALVGGEPKILTHPIILWRVAGRPGRARLVLLPLLMITIANKLMTIDDIMISLWVKNDVFFIWLN